MDFADAAAKALPAVAGALAGAYVIRLAKCSSARSAKRQAGRLIVRPAKWTSWIGLAGLVTVTFIVILVALDDKPRNAISIGAILTIVTMFFAGSLYLLIEGIKRYYAYDAEGLERISPLLGNVKFQWSDLREIDRVEWRTSFALDFGDKGRMHLPDGLVGGDGLMEYARRRLAGDR